MGTQFSLGRARWTTEDASIFSVADGKRLVNTPTKATSVYENIRAVKIQRAALETPTVAGYRLLPELTPGRAFLWGTVLAVWATTAVVMGTARTLDIKDTTDASGKLKSFMRPVADALDRFMTPFKSGLALPGVRQDTMESELVRKLKVNLGSS